MCMGRLNREGKIGKVFLKNILSKQLPNLLIGKGIKSCLSEKDVNPVQSNVAAWDFSQIDSLEYLKNHYQSSSANHNTSD